MKRIMTRLALCILTGIFLVACQQEMPSAENDRQAFHTRRTEVLATFQPCQRNATTPQAALVAESLCLDYNVPENYDTPQGREIPLKVMVIPSLSDIPEPDPLFLLAGGPGQAATDLTQVAQVFSRVRTDRDIVLVDQRGTGELSPFDCQLDEEELQALEDEDPNFDEMLAIQLQLIRDCLEATEASPEFYTTDIAMRDLDAIRTMLGYSRLNLWGASYGSRAALAYLQAYPENTRAVIIDAIAPPALTLPVFNERDASASLSQLFDDCAADSECSVAFPELESHYRALITRLEAPQPVTFLNDSDFSSLDTSIEQYEFLNFLRQVLYSREAQRLIPLIIEQAYQENYRPVFALASQYAEAQINQGMFLSVICSEDNRLITDDMLDNEAEGDYLIRSEMFNAFILSACEIWPSRQIDERYFDPVTADRPTLIFSGALDPVTPPVWGELVHRSLRNSLHLVLEGFAHGTPFSSCTADLMNTFIDSGTLDELDTECISRFGRRPFFVTPGGSVLSDD